MSKKSNRLILVIITLAVLVYVANFVRVNIVNTAVEQGKSAYDRQDYDLAISAYTRANKLIFWEKEKKADNLLWRGRAYYYGKLDFNMAIADFTKAIELRSDYVAYYLWRGRAYQEKEEWDSAIADFTKAIELEDSSRDKWFKERGDVYDQKGDYARAILDYNRAIAEIDARIAERLQLNIEYPEYSFDNNELYEWRDEVIAQRSYVESRQQRELMANAKPGTREYRAETHYQRGLEYANNREQNNAKKDVYSASKDGISKRDRIEALLDSLFAYPGDLNMAIKEWEEALRIYPDHIGAKENIKRARAQRGY